jgi:hypothetical protein
VIERHRQEHGIRDRQLALGRKPDQVLESAAWRQTAKELAPLQRELGVGRELGPERSVGMEIGL